MRIPTLQAIPDYSKKTVGRPKKNYSTALIDPAPKKRGRPKKTTYEIPPIPADEPKKRGRPKKIKEEAPKEPKKRGRPKKIKNDTQPASQAQSQPLMIPKAPRISKDDFLAYLEDETDYVPINIKTIKKASNDFLKGLGEDDEIFYKIVPELRQESAPPATVPPVAGGRQKLAPKSPRVISFVAKLEALPEDKKKRAIETMKLVRMSTTEIIDLIRKKNLIAGTAGLTKQQLIEKYLKMLKL